jgi:ABC-type transport system substrate-binding protein
MGANKRAVRASQVSPERIATGASGSAKGGTLNRAHLRLVLGALIAGVSLIVAGAAGGAPAKTSAGTVVFGAEQEPPCLNGFLEGCNNTWTSWTVGIALPGVYLITPKFALAPYMGTGRVVKKKPFTLDVTVDPKAKWSDGRIVGADDLIFTWQTIVNPQWELASRSGWDSIARAKKISAKTVRFTFKQPYAAWKLMLATGVLPKHALQGQNFNEVWNNNYNKPGTNVTMASGPFKLSSYTKGQTMTMVRNSTFWGKRPTVDRIVFRFITVTDSEIQAIRGGEVDAIYPQPQLQLASLRGQSGINVQSNAGASLEHVDINSGARSGNPLLRQLWFRQAIAYAINRQQMVTQLFRTLNRGLKPLNNLSFTNQQRYYVPHFAKYTRNLNKVNALFRAHGCTKGGDGIYTCAGQRASVRLGTTAGNRLRELGVEILQAQAKAAGIEFKPDNQPSRLFFPRLAEENYDLALFAWVGSGDPAGQADIYGIGGGSNWKGYRSPTVTSLFRRSDATLDVKSRMALVNKADAILANDLATIPLYQKPTYFVFKSKLRGLLDNPTSQGPTWNVETWRAG